jgi:acyl carrier protein
MSELKEKLKAQIIEQLNIEDMQVANIDDDVQLFNENGLGLDSIDALELIVLLDSQYGIKIENPAEGRMIFESINTLAAYIEKNS